MKGETGRHGKATGSETPDSKTKRKARGIDQAIANADPWSFESGLRLVLALALAGRPFTADNLAATGLVFDHPCRYGALLSVAHKAGIVRRLGYTPSTRNGRNGSVISVWVAGENAK